MMKRRGLSRNWHTFILDKPTLHDSVLPMNSRLPQIIRVSIQAVVVGLFDLPPQRLDSLAFDACLID